MKLTFLFGAPRNFVSIGMIGVLLSGCVETGGNVTGSTTAHPVRETAVQKAIGQCMMTVAGGAILGAILGGDRNAKNGALAGAAIGAGACAILMQVAAREDQKRLVEAQQAALHANHSKTSSFKTKSGKHAVVRTKVQSAPTPKPTAKTSNATPEFTNCRYASQQITVDGKSTDTPKQLWCRLPTGDWQPYDAK